jgi:hypothetical protein
MLYGFKIVVKDTMKLRAKSISVRVKTEATVLACKGDTPMYTPW